MSYSQGTPLRVRCSAAALRTSCAVRARFDACPASRLPKHGTNLAISRDLLHGSRPLDLSAYRHAVVAQSPSTDSGVESEAAPSEIRTMPREPTRDRASDLIDRSEMTEIQHDKSDHSDI